MNLLILFSGEHLQEQLAELRYAKYLEKLWKIRIVDQGNAEIPRITSPLNEKVEVVLPEEAVEHWDDVMHHIILKDKDWDNALKILGLLNKNQYFYQIWCSVSHFDWKYRV
jgi:hypothetical protein